MRITGFNSIRLHRIKLTYFFLLLSSKRLLLAVLNSGGFFKIFSFLPLPNNPLLLYLPFKFLQRFFQGFIFINYYVRYKESPPLCFINKLKYTVYRTISPCQPSLSATLVYVQKLPDPLECRKP